jgi:hypothetical protein
MSPVLEGAHAGAPLQKLLKVISGTGYYKPLENRFRGYPKRLRREIINPLRKRRGQGIYVTS